MLLDKDLVPVRERVKYLWAVGYGYSDISQIINEEFKDINMSEISASGVRKMHELNKPEFEAARADLTERCREELKLQVSNMFHKTSAVEMRTVDVLVKKLDSVLTQFEDLDVSDLGEKETRGKFFTLLEAAERIQSRIAQIAGTNAFRDIEVYRQKMLIAVEAKNQEKPGNLPSMRDATPTKWID